MPPEHRSFATFIRVSILDTTDRNNLPQGFQAQILHTTIHQLDSLDSQVGT